MRKRVGKMKIEVDIVKFTEMNEELIRQEMINFDQKLYIDEATYRIEMLEKALELACELMLGGVIYGNDQDTIFKKIMEEQGIVYGVNYAQYLVEHYEEITKVGEEE